MIEFNRSSHFAPQTNDDVKIKIFGVGGAGLNALDRIVLDGANGAELVVMNTDVQSLTSSVANDKIQLGRDATRGLGAGGDPEVGQAAAEEAADEIRSAMEGADMVFICAGLGGGTGSGAAPLVASMAKELGALVVVFATRPFSFEGKRRAKQADEALVALHATADAVICFENDTMGDAVSPRAGIHQAFAAADETISQSVRAVSTLFTCPGILHIGFDDLCAALRTASGGAGSCLFGFGESSGDNRAYEAVARALKNPLMDRGRMIEEAHNVLVSVAGGPDMTLNEVQILMEELGKHIGDETQILFGTSVDPRMGDAMSVTIISSMSIGSLATEFVQPHTAFSSTQAQRTHKTAEPIQHAATPAVSHFEEPEPEPVAIAEEPEEDFLRDVAPEPMPEPVPVVANAQSRPVSQPPKHVAEPVPPRREERQATLQFEPVTRGRFEKSEPTIVDGQDLDVPTWLRRNVRVK